MQQRKAKGHISDGSLHEYMAAGFTCLSPAYLPNARSSPGACAARKNLICIIDVEFENVQSLHCGLKSQTLKRQKR